MVKLNCFLLICALLNTMADQMTQAPAANNLVVPTSMPPEWAFFFQQLNSQMTSQVTTNLASSIDSSVANALTKYNAVLDGHEQRISTTEQDVNKLNNEVAELKLQNTTLNNRNIQLKDKLTEMNNELFQIQNHQSQQDAKMDILEQKSKLINCEFTNIPEFKGENCIGIVRKFLTAINSTVDHKDVLVAHRINSSNTRVPRPIIARMASQGIAATVIQDFRKVKPLTLDKLKLTFPPDIRINRSSNVYVNTQLSIGKKQLLGYCMEEKRLHGWKFCWVKDTRILIKRTGLEKFPTEIKSDSDLHRLCEGDVFDCNLNCPRVPPVINEQTGLVERSNPYSLPPPLGSPRHRPKNQLARQAMENQARRRTNSFSPGGRKRRSDQTDNDQLSFNFNQPKPKSPKTANQIVLDISDARLAQQSTDIQTLASDPLIDLNSSVEMDSDIQSAAAGGVSPHEPPTSEVTHATKQGDHAAAASGVSPHRQMNNFKPEQMATNHHTDQEDKESAGNLSASDGFRASQSEVSVVDDGVVFSNHGEPKVTVPEPKKKPGRPRKNT